MMYVRLGITAAVILVVLGVWVLAWGIVYGGM